MVRVLGIDPGYDKLGLAVVEKNAGGKERLIYSDCLKTEKKSDFFDRLHELGEGVEKIIGLYKPQVLAIEKLFFTKNQKTAMRVSEARGMILYLAKKNKLQILEYTPLQVKTAITGYGQADKKQIMLMVGRLVEIKNKIKEDDEYDAIALALTASPLVRLKNR